MRYALDAYTPFPNVEWRNAVQERFEVPTLVRLLRLPRGGDLLELGCGRGVGLAALGRELEPRSLAGIDLAADLLAEVATRAPSARVVAGDVRSLPFSDAAFDLLFDFGTLHHVPRPDRALREIERVLRPGGLFVHETRLAQLVSHPTRFTGARLPWEEAPALRPEQHAGCWAARRKAVSRAAARGAARRGGA